MEELRSQPKVGYSKRNSTNASLPFSALYGILKALIESILEENTMSIGSKIMFYRKRLGITQDALAQKLEVSNQAVSKWESGQCCPDISLLPLLADIFGTTIDELFGREAQSAEFVPNVPWEDDGTLHIAVFHGRTFIGRSSKCNEMSFQYEGPALNIDCALNLRCGAVSGNVAADGGVQCENVYGSVHSGGSITCDDVYGDVNAGGNVTCDNVGGNAHAGSSITCDIVEGDAKAGANITCAEICGTVTAEGDVICDEINIESSPDGMQSDYLRKSVHIHKVERSEGDTHTVTYTIQTD